MLATMETYLRRGQRSLQRLALEPRAQQLARVVLYWGGGFLLSAASLKHTFQPLAMGLILALSGWQAGTVALGAVLGYRFFWGSAGIQGMIWAAAGGMVAVFLGKRKDVQELPLLLSALGAFLVSAIGLIFQMGFQDQTGLGIYLLRITVAGLSVALARRVFACRDNITDWVAGAAGTLALAQIAPLGVNLGYLTGGLLSVGFGFPAAALAGLGLDLAQVTRLPMTAVVCIAYFGRLLPFPAKAVRYLAPPGAGLLVMALCGIWEPQVLPGLMAGGLLGMAVPVNRQSVHRRGELGLAQVRLELTAGILSYTQQLLLETRVPEIDEEALLQKARERGCAGCSARNACRDRENLTRELLNHPLEFQCRKTGRILGELRRAQEQLRLLRADRQRQREYRAAVVQQYQFLSEYLRRLADQLPQRGERPAGYYRMEVSARSLGKERANGDRCAAFPGTGCLYYLLLCDGMGTGLGAAEEGHTAVYLLKQMLTAGLPADHACRSINSILALRGQAGAVTLDLAEVRLDTGRVTLYKWGAAPSYILRRGGLEKIGTAGPPPGISVTDTREMVVRLSLHRGEALILLSDGAQGEQLHRLGLTYGAPPGELAEQILHSCRGAGEDDATAAVLRLRPAGQKKS